MEDESGTDSCEHASAARLLFTKPIQAQVCSGIPAPTRTSTMGDDIANLSMILNRSCTRDTLRMPWERGIMGSVFNSRASVIPVPVFELPKLPSVPSIVEPVRITDPLLTPRRPVVSFLLRKLRSIDIPDKRDSMKVRAMNRWRIIIEQDLGASQVGRQLTEYIEDGKAESLIISTLEDVLGTKSVATLMKRSSSILRFLQWGRSCTPSLVSPLGFDEAACYRYVDHLRTIGAGASAAKNFREALNFLKYVLGMPQVEAAITSSRLKGACSKQLATKRPLKQAPPLTVVQVRILHHVVCNAPDNRDRCKAGYDLFCIYACSRHGDAMWPSKVNIDLDEEGSGFIELYTTNHKVATNDERRSIFLPLIAMSPGLCEEPWAIAWLKARERSLLEFCSMPTMPAPCSGGSWTNRSIEPGESAAWTRELLATYGGVSAMRTVRPSTHSCKATLLAWACKFGIDKDFRRILGHHLDSQEVSILTYSRAAMDIPLEKVVQMISAINEGSFDPDCSRLLRRRMREAVTSSAPTGANKLTGPTRPQGLVGADNRPVVDQGFFDEGEVEPSARSSDEVQWYKVSGDEEAASFSPDMDEVDVAVEPTLPPSAAIMDSALNSDSSAMSSDSSSSEGECSDSAKFDEQAVKDLCGIDECAPHPFWTAEGVKLKVVQHNKSGVLHCRDSGSLLACGRPMSAGYSRVDALKLKWPVCLQCRNKNPVITAVRAVAKATSVAP